jgi:hypothetical protein
MSIANNDNNAGVEELSELEWHAIYRAFRPVH